MAATRKSSEGVFRYSVAHLLIALVLLLVIIPLVEEVIGGEVVESVVMTIVLLSAAVAVGGHRRSLVIGLLLVIPAVLGKWVDHIWPGFPREISQAAAIFFLAFVTYRLLRYILTAPRVDSEVLCAAIAVYLILGLVWGFAYILIAGLNPTAFAFRVSTDPNTAIIRFQALYFSFMTLTTVGYGDIVPVSKPARLLAMTESTIGILYTTILIARLVALYSGGGSGRGK